MMTEAEFNKKKRTITSRMRKRTKKIRELEAGNKEDLKKLLALRDDYLKSQLGVDDA